MPAKWKKVVMSQVCDITSSKRIYRADYQPHGVPFYRGKEIIEKQRGALDVSTELFISEDKFRGIEKKFGVPQAGDLLLSSVGTLGVPYVIQKEERFYFKDGNLTWFKNFRGLESRFLYFWLLSSAGKAQLGRCTIGSSQPALTIVLLKQMEIDLPSIEDQQRIIHILSAYDDLCENNIRRIKILEEMAQNLYREWFVKFRFPGHEKVRMVESELGKVPEGWSVVPLEAVCERITDGAHRSPKTVEAGFPMASVKDMHDWGIDFDTCRQIAKEDFDDLVHNDCRMRKDDVLIAKDGSYLKHCFVVEKDFDVALLSSIAMLRPNDEIYPHLLAMTLKEPGIKARMKNFVSGAALPRIILKDFKKFLIVLPPSILQSRWLDLAEPMARQCWRLLDANRVLRRTRDILLPKLITATLDVSELDIDVPEEAA